MTQTTILELAKQGDAKAIAALMNSKTLIIMTRLNKEVRRRSPLALPKGSPPQASRYSVKRQTLMTTQPIENQTEPTPSLIEPLDQESIEKAIQLLDSWCDVDEEEAKEQCETLEYLMKVLDADRLSYRKLFP